MLGKEVQKLSDGFRVNKANLMLLMFSSSWISRGNRKRELLSPLRLSDTTHTRGHRPVFTKRLEDTMSHVRSEDGQAELSGLELFRHFYFIVV